MADTWITLTRKKDLLGYVDQLKKLSGGPVEEEDLYAAGFSERDLEDIGWFASQRKAASEAGDGSKLEAYTPTSRDNVRNNIAGGLRGIGLDKHLARSVAVKIAGEENPADGSLGMGVADFTPLGALFGVEEGTAAVKRGVNSGDYTSAGLGALNAATSVASALPGGKIVSQGVNKLAEKLAGQYDPSVVRTFFGPTSAKADIPRLKEAEEMSASGQWSEEEVWRRTGWWNGPNGWRFEVDDSQMVLPEGALENTIEGKNKNVIKHNDFWDAMSPREELSDADWVDQENAKFGVQQGNTTLGPMDAGKWAKGSFDPRNNSISAYGYGETDQKETLVHEMQHAIQTVLGDKGTGANPEAINEHFQATLNALPRDLRDAAKTSAELGYSKVRLQEVDKTIADLEAKVAKEAALNEEALTSSITSSEEVWPKGWDKVDTEGSSLEVIDDLRREKNLLTRNIATKTKIVGYQTESYPDFAATISEFETVGQGVATELFGRSQDLTTDLFSKSRMLDPVENKLTDEAAHTLYTLEAGEVEARVAGKRAAMDSATRSVTLPKTDVRDDVNVYGVNQLVDWLSGIRDYAKRPDKKGYAKGGVVQEKDPVSGNEVPPGAEPAEVRDDIDAKLSDGEYVIPADVVRYIGLDKIEKLIMQAKEGLAEMDQQGRIGGEEVPVEDDLPFTDDELSEILPDSEAAEGEPPVMHMAIGGLVSAGDRIRSGVLSPTTGPTQSSGLPPWMVDQGQTASRGALPIDVTGLAAPPKDSWADRQAEKTPMGMAGPVETWKAKDFSSAVKQRSGDPGVRVVEKIVGTIPFGNIAMQARNKYLDKKVPGAIDNMIASGKDVDGTPLSQQQISDLQKAKLDFTATEGYKATGLKGLLKDTVKSIIKPKDKVEKKETTGTKSNKQESSADKKTSSSSSKTSPSKTSPSKGSSSSSKSTTSNKKK